MAKLVSNIVFTKNRPLQFEAYLESLYRHFPAEIIQTYILYKEELFGEQYDELFGRYPNCTVIRETDFHGDFLKLLNEINTRYILFGIDDVVYFDSVDFKVIDETFKKFPSDIFGFSLRFGEKTIKAGNDILSQTAAADETVYGIDWTKGQTSVTRYPFELCATIYPMVLVGNIIKSSMSSNKFARKLFLPDSGLIKLISKVMKPRKILKKFGFFFNPNTLESWNCKWCQRNIDKIPHYIYFQKNCASAIQVNMVNTSTLNEYDKCEWTVERLNEMYKQGYRFDINKLKENKPAKTQSDKSYFLLTREQENQCPSFGIKKWT
jgi:hypothetical protein